MDSLLNDFEEAKRYVLNRIKELNFSESHPFLDIKYEKDITLVWFAFLKMYIKETFLIDRFLLKLKANKNNRFNQEIFHQAMGEFEIFMYFFFGLIQSNNLSRVHTIINEPENLIDNQSKIEYTFSLYNVKNSLDLINIEVKTISCDVFIREKSLPLNDGTILIKPIFKDKSIKERIRQNESGEYIILESSTHYRQLRDNIKDINEKYKGNKLVPYNMINIGVVVIEFATSIEEFFPCLLHPEKGLIYNQNFDNIDVLVFFSLTAKTEIDMDDIYEDGHVFCICLKNTKEILNYIKLFRLNNIAYIDGKATDEIKDFINQEYIKLKVVNRRGLLFTVPYDSIAEKVDEYISNYLD